jgi:hypothetical protein
MEGKRTALNLNAGGRVPTVLVAIPVTIRPQKNRVVENDEKYDGR